VVCGTWVQESASNCSPNTRPVCYHVKEPTSLNTLLGDSAMAEIGPSRRQQDAVERGAAPHPNPLPVKDGERVLGCCCICPLCTRVEDDGSFFSLDGITRRALWHSSTRCLPSIPRQSGRVVQRFARAMAGSAQLAAQWEAGHVTGAPILQRQG
jgi:hypothetical protein